MTELGVTFDEASHTYWCGSQRIPGVTEVLRPLVNFDRVPPAVLAAKADLGRRVHFAAQLHDEDDLDEASIEPDVLPYLEAYRRFLAETGAVIVNNEARVFSPVYRYAGTLDRVLLLNGQHWMVDLKTSLVTPATVGPQTAAYLRALDNPAVTHRAALRLRPDGTYRLDPLTDPNDFSLFLACLTIHRHLESTAA